jgi:GNAT superfamily N-acetyltransferase
MSDSLPEREPAGALPFRIRPLAPADRAWLASLLVAHWGSTILVSRGRRHEAAALPGFIAEEHGERRGVLLHALTREESGAAGDGATAHAGAIARDGAACAVELEIVLVESLVPGRGIASALLAAAEGFARSEGAARVWLVTTNDNQPAIDFYARRGYRRVAVHAGAVTAARRLKPEIPACGVGGRPITDEIEFERRL